VQDVKSKLVSDQNTMKEQAFFYTSLLVAKFSKINDKQAKFAYLTIKNDELS